MKRLLALLTFAAVALAACGERSTGTAPAGSDTALTAPDAGTTGVVPPSPEQAAPPPAEAPK